MSDNLTTLGSGDMAPEDVERKRRATLLSLILFALVFPGIIVTVVFMWVMVSIQKNQPKVVYATYAILAVPTLALLIFAYSPFVTHTTEGIIAATAAGGPPTALLWIYLMKIPFEILIGGLIGCFYIAYRMFFRDKWETLNFKPTPIQRRNERQNIADIEQDRNSPVEGRTLGIETYRYYPEDEKGTYKKNRGPVNYGMKLIQEDYEAAAHTLVLGAAGSGKALDVDTPILTPYGYVKMGSLTSGDLVYGRNMKIIPVLAGFNEQKDKPSYVFKFNNGESIVSDEEHLWALVDNKNYTSKAIVSMFDKGSKIAVPAPRRQTVHFLARHRKIDIDPFVLGSLYHLENGTLMGGQQGPLTAAEWLNRGYHLPQDNTGHYTPDSAVEFDTDALDAYLIGSVEERKDLLCGILYTGGFLLDDSDVKAAGLTGHVVGYENENDALLTHLVQLSTTLGLHVIRVKNTVLMSTKAFPEMKTSRFDVRSGYSSEMDDLVSTEKEYTLTSVERTVRTVRCIKVGACDGIFLAGYSCVPTHNTTTLLLMARDIIKQGEGFAFVDLKGGDDVPTKLKEYADRYGKRFIHWTMHDAWSEYEGPSDNGPGYYDPITRGDPSRRKDLILTLRKWDTASDVYKNASAAYLQTLFNVVRLSPNPDPGVDTLTDVIGLMQGAPALLARLDLVPPQDRSREYDKTRQDVSQMMMHANKVQQDSIKTTQQTLQVFSQSIAGVWLGKDPEGEQDINLWDIANNGDVVCFSLDSSNYPELSQNIANLIIQDLKTASSEFRANRPNNNLNVFIDEFSAIESDNLVQLVNKCRDAHIPVTFATQTLADMKTVSDTFAEQLNGIISSFIVHRVNSDKDAEEYAGIFGKEQKAIVTKNVEHTSGLFGGIGRGSATGTGRLTYELDYIVPVKKLQELSTGHAVYHTKATGKKGSAGRTYYVKVVPESYADNNDVRHLDSTTKNRYADMSVMDATAQRPVPPSRAQVDAPIEDYDDYEPEDDYAYSAPAPSTSSLFASAKGAVATQNRPKVQKQTAPTRRMTMTTPENNDLPDFYDFPENEELGEIDYSGHRSDIASLVNVSILEKGEQNTARQIFASGNEAHVEPMKKARRTPRTAPQQDYFPEEDYSQYSASEEDYDAPEEDYASYSAPKPAKPAAPSSPARPTRSAPPRPQRPQKPQRPSGKGVPTPPARPQRSHGAPASSQGAPAPKAPPAVPKKGTGAAPSRKAKPQPLPEMKTKNTQKINDSDELGSKFTW